MPRWFSRPRAQEPPLPQHLNNVIAGTGFSQRVVGYVDDFASVYNLSRRYLGRVEAGVSNEEHVVISADTKIVGSVGHNSEAVHGGAWHKVYDRTHTLIGLVDNASEITTAGAQTIAHINYNEGNGGTGWLRAGAALLLLLRDSNSLST